MRRLQRVQRLARSMDRAFSLPGTNIRLGWDGIVGLVPGIGDSLTTAVSGYIVYEAARLGCPKHVLLRMVGNVAIDGVIGSIPLLGDLFDIGWKANSRNALLLERTLAQQPPRDIQPRDIKQVQRLALTTVVVLLALPVLAGVLLFALLLGLLS